MDTHACRDTFSSTSAGPLLARISRALYLAPFLSTRRPGHRDRRRVPFARPPHARLVDRVLSVLESLRSYGLSFDTLYRPASLGLSRPFTSIAGLSRTQPIAVRCPHFHPAVPLLFPQSACSAPMIDPRSRDRVRRSSPLVAGEQALLSILSAANARMRVVRRAMNRHGPCTIVQTAPHNARPGRPVDRLLAAAAHLDPTELIIMLLRRDDPLRPQVHDCNRDLRRDADRVLLRLS